jgi:hypothetical protein
VLDHEWEWMVPWGIRAAGGRARSRPEFCDHLFGGQRARARHSRDVIWSLYTKPFVEGIAPHVLQRDLPRSVGLWFELFAWVAIIGILVESVMIARRAGFRFFWFLGAALLGNVVAIGLELEIWRSYGARLDSLGTAPEVLAASVVPTGLVYTFNFLLIGSGVVVPHLIAARTRFRAEEDE